MPPAGSSLALGITEEQVTEAADALASMAAEQAEADPAASSTTSADPATAAPGGDPLPQPVEPPRPTPAILPVVDVRELDWGAVRERVAPDLLRARMRATVERMEALLDLAGGPGMLFDDQRADPADRAIRLSSVRPDGPLWIIGDLHGDLLALEAVLALIRHSAPADAEAMEAGAMEAGIAEAGTAEAGIADAGVPPRIVFLGDVFDDAGFGLETLLRVFELIADAPHLVCIVAGNHDEALGYDGARFFSTVSPSDFADFLNENLAHEWIVRAGKLAVRLFARAPRALFFPDGLLIAHGGFPLVDLHHALAETGDWNAPACLADFVWTRAHPKARKKLPNRFTRGSQFGYEDFAAFCAVAATLGRPVSHMVRGHDHVDDRYAVYPAYAAHPILTTVALSRRLPREGFGPYERVPTMARYVEGTLPQTYRLHVPAEMIRELYPEPSAPPDSGNAGSVEESTA